MHTHVQTHTNVHTHRQIPSRAPYLGIPHSLCPAVTWFEVIFYELLVQIYGLISFGAFMRCSVLHVLHCEVQK